MHRSTYTTRTKVIWSLIIFLLAISQFPGVLFFHDMAEPKILGLPFIYGYIILVWAALCAVLFWAYKTRWGRRPLMSRNAEAPNGGGTE